MDFEKLGSFYLGRELDPATGKQSDRPVLYDARDLCTHAVCVGMTGSGKTGLCISLLEEAAIDRVPAIIIDPKGDIANLLLQFPDLGPSDFAPWINADDARRKGMDEAAFATAQADAWRKGLAEWGMGPERIRALRDSADFAIYTPGSEAGIPVSILRSFAAPPAGQLDDAEALRERIGGTVGALLGLMGIEADPVRSREHILLATILEHHWRRGEDLDLARLILAIQEPPVRTLGVFDVDTFYPQKERFALAMALNNLVASPAFAAWTTGQPLDIAGFLATGSGKPRHSIFSIAHLSDAERMFFVTMLLEQVIAWMRTQPGTTSLRAILYMDEIFGFFPPVANPPSKTPMLTLLKQARAFGLGIVLTTQNPVDLDYKGLTNTGTWFIGRLQTERDKMRVLEGLEGAATQAGASLDRGALDKLISSLGNRVFLLHNVHEEAPVVFQTRWAMAYLRGPLTKVQIKSLMDGRRPDGSDALPAATAPFAAGAGQSAPPRLPAEVRQVFIPVRIGRDAVAGEVGRSEGAPVTVEKASLTYAPAVLGVARVHYADRRLGIDEKEDVSLLIPPPGEGAPSWEEAVPLPVTAQDLAASAEAEATFEALPETLNDARDLSKLAAGLVDHLYRSRSLTLAFNPAVKAYSRPGESERDFALRLSQSSREERDREVDKIEDRFRGKIETLSDRLRRAEGQAAKKQAEATSRKAEVLVSVGETVLGMFLGRRSTRAASSAMSKYRQSRSAGMGAQDAAENADDLKRDMAAIEEELRRETYEISKRWDAALAANQPVAVKPKKSDVQADLVALAWAPHWSVAYKDAAGFPRNRLVPAW